MRFSSRARRSLSKTTDGSGRAHLSAAKAGAEDSNGASSSVSSTQSARKAAEDEELQQIYLKLKEERMLEPERTQRYLRNGACDEHGSRRGQQGAPEEGGVHRGPVLPLCDVISTAATRVCMSCGH